MEAQPEPDNQNKPEKPKSGSSPFEGNEEDEEPEQEGDDYETITPEARMRKESANMDSLVRLLSAERVPVHVHDIIIRGNARTKDTVIESEVEELLRGATTFQELRHAAGVAEERLRGLDIFKSVNVTLDAGPPELPGTANVVIVVSEPSNPFAGKPLNFTRFGAGSFEVTGKLGSLFGYGDKWDASVVYGSGQIGGLSVLPRFCAIRLEVELLHAIPLGFCGAELNLGVSAGAVFPWGRGPLNAPSFLPKRFFTGGTPISSLGGPFSVLSFRERDAPFTVLGSPTSLALGSFADLSFHLPLKVLRDAAIHGHVFASTGSLIKLTENAYRVFSLQKLEGSFRETVGVGVIISTRLFRMEVNYFYSINQQGYDQGKTGIEFSFSS